MDFVLATQRSHVPPLLFDSASRLASERVEERGSIRGKSASRIPALDSRSAPHLTIRSCFPPYGYPPPHPLHSFPASCLSPSADSPTLAPPSDAHFHLITIASDALIDDQRSKGVKGRGSKGADEGRQHALSRSRLLLHSQHSLSRCHTPSLLQRQLEFLSHTCYKTAADEQEKSVTCCWFIVWCACFV